MARLAHVYQGGRSGAKFISPLLLQAEEECFGKVPVIREPRHAIITLEFSELKTPLVYIVFSLRSRGRQDLWAKVRWESAKVSHKRVFALLTPEIHNYEMAQMLQKPVFALPGCQRMSVNTLLCDTLGLADLCAHAFCGDCEHGTLRNLPRMST